MSVDFTKWLQGRLSLHGFELTVDGLLGTKTSGALVAFQRRHRLRTSGTTTAETVAALRLDPNGVDPGPVKIAVRPAWLAELERRKGLHEVRDYGVLSRWLRSDGRTLGDPRKLPWCGDGIQTAIALTLPHEPQLANPYLARNWLAFGKPTKARTGAIMVFSRGSRTGTSGHVALYLGEDRDSFEVIGCNQTNGITVTRIDKDRFLGGRWPLTDSLETAAVQRTLNAPLSTNEA